MSQVQAGLAAWAICRVPAGLPAVSWLVDLHRELAGHCPAMVNGPAWDSDLCVSVGQGLPEWQLNFPGGAEQLAASRMAWLPVSAVTWLGSLDWLGAVQASACAATGSASAMPNMWERRADRHEHSPQPLCCSRSGRSQAMQRWLVA